tara:strand:- start:102 stop:1010 length:909 start_codon:yes stop_codon:yes gene_type:complete
MNSSYCSPISEDNYKKTKTCYNLTQLKLIAKKFNQIFSNFNSNRLYKINLKNKKIQIHSDLSNNINILYKKNIHESNWPEIDFLKNIKHSIKDELNDMFRPEKPDSWNYNDREWLNTYDILNVMNQYEKKYKSFKFLGVYPIDYDYRFSDNQCVANILCNLNIKNLLKIDINQLGVIFNLDKHNEPGSHWVSLYFGLSPKNKNFGSFYIDSNSTESPEEVKRLISNVYSQINSYYNEKDSKKFKRFENSKQFQFKNTECGMFSMYFMIQFLKKKTINDIINTNIHDDDVHKFRNILYNPLKN